MPKATNIDEYIATFPEGVQTLLQQLRGTIKQVLPDAEEVISYSIPCFKFRGKYIVYFAGWKEHVSLYPIPSGDAAFRKAITPYVAGRGTLKFPLDKPLPLDLVAKVTTFRLAESQQKKR